MSYDKEDYRNTMEKLDQMYPDRLVLTVKEAMDITGYKSRDAFKRHYPVTNNGICKATLARCICMQPRKR